ERFIAGATLFDRNVEARCCCADEPSNGGGNAVQRRLGRARTTRPRIPPEAGDRRAAPATDASRTSPANQAALTGCACPTRTVLACIRGAYGNAQSKSEHGQPSDETHTHETFLHFNERRDQARRAALTRTVTTCRARP